VNSGIFWTTKESLTRIGHNGADPGLVTMMLSDVDKQIGVILFVNTAIRQEDGEAYGAIFDGLWQLGVDLKAPRRTRSWGYLDKPHLPNPEYFENSVSYQ